MGDWAYEEMEKILDERIDEATENAYAKGKASAQAEIDVLRKHQERLRKWVADGQAEIDELKSEIKPRPAYDYQRKRILSLQAEIDELVDMLERVCLDEDVDYDDAMLLIKKHKGE